MTPQSKASELSTSPTFWQTHSRHISSDLLGADVIKTEDPNELDKSRDSGTDNDLNHAGMGIGFLTQGSDKRAITLDLKTEEGRTILKKLAATADVLLDENFLLSEACDDVLLAIPIEGIEALPKDTLELALVTRRRPVSRAQGFRHGRRP
jgi:hypothetical protein